MLGHASEHSLKSVMEARELFELEKSRSDMAVKALRFAKQNSLSLSEAITVLNSVHKKT